MECNRLASGSPSGAVNSVPSMHSPGASTPVRVGSSQDNNSSSTGAPTADDMSCTNVACRALSSRNTALLTEFRYSLSDFDSTRLGEEAGMTSRAAATRGLPPGSSQDSSYACQTSSP